MAALGLAALGMMNLTSAYGESKAIREQGLYQKSALEGNAKVAEFMAKDAERRGERDAQEHIKATRQIVGAQRAGFAAQGVDVNSGVAADVQADTKYMGEQDAVTIRNNAWREAWGYRVAATDLYGQGKMADIASKNKSRQTLIAGGINALDYGVRAGYAAWGKK